MSVQQANPASPAGTIGATAASPTRLGVDAPTRMFHALFAFSFFGAWLSAETERLRLVHVTLGYTMAGLLVFRILYGLFGPRQARLGLLWQRLRAARSWWRDARRAPDLMSVPWRRALPVLVGLSIATALLATVPLVLSGYASYQDWGDVIGGDLFEELHEALGEGVLNLVLLHLFAVLALSLSMKRNLAMQMVHGRIPGRGPDPVRRNRRWLAASMLVAVLGFWAWQWQQAPQLSPGAPGRAYPPVSKIWPGSAADHPVRARS
ncbi:MAG: cytochrome b/b6 domain-containing protein [Burkholderiaceae bacterium]